MEPLAVLAQAERDEPAGTSRDESDEPHRRENRDLGAELGQEHRAVTEHAEPQEIDQQLVGEPQDNQDDDDNRGEAEQDNPRSHLYWLPALRGRAQSCSRARAPRQAGTTR